MSLNSWISLRFSVFCKSFKEKAKYQGAPKTQSAVTLLLLVGNVRKSSFFSFDVNHQNTSSTWSCSAPGGEQHQRSVRATREYLRLSLCVLYSMMVFVGRFRTRRKVSRIRDVVIWSLEVLFQMDRMSSCGERRGEVTYRCPASCPGAAKHSGALGRTWKRMETTAPQISSPTMNCSPNMARMMFSQNLLARPLRRRMIHLPPLRLESS